MTETAQAALERHRTARCREVGRRAGHVQLVDGGGLDRRAAGGADDREQVLLTQRRSVCCPVEMKLMSLITPLTTMSTVGVVCGVGGGAVVADGLKTVL